jgi:hypothetical protein
VRQAANPDAKLIVFGGDDIGAETAHGAEDFAADQEAAARGADDAGGLLPLHIAKLVVEAGVGIDFANMSTGDPNFRALIECFNALVEPRAHQVAIAVEKLNKLHLGFDAHQRGEAFVAGSGGAEGSVRIELDDVTAHLAGIVGAAVF